MKCSQLVEAEEERKLELLLRKKNEIDHFIREVQIAESKLESRRVSIEFIS